MITCKCGLVVEDAQKVCPACGCALESRLSGQQAHTPSEYVVLAVVGSSGNEMVDVVPFGAQAKRRLRLQTAAFDKVCYYCRSEIGWSAVVCRTCQKRVHSGLHVGALLRVPRESEATFAQSLALLESGQLETEAGSPYPATHSAGIGTGILALVGVGAIVLFTALLGATGLLVVIIGAAVLAILKYLWKSGAVAVIAKVGMVIGYILVIALVMATMKNCCAFGNCIRPTSAF
jgi:hypothetical protein